MIRRRLLVLLFLVLAVEPGFAVEEIGSRVKAIVLSQQLIDAGEFEQAVDYLDRAVGKYPKDDQLLSLHGEALYQSRKIEEAEVLFRRALAVNPLNPLAKARVERIRETSIATTSVKAQVIESVAWDKAGDVVVLGLGFFLGTLISGAVTNFKSRRLIARSKRHFLRGQYENFVDVLEIQLAENNLHPLRECLKFMREHKTLQESSEILSGYVNTRENLNTLLRMVELNDARRV
jgi:tetratricopeptide (TPR) repeat protein